MGRKYYVATVTGNAMSKSKDKGTPSVNIKVQLNYEQNDPNQKPIGKTLYGNLWLTYACARKTVETLQKVFGWEGQNITDFNEPILFGKKCIVVTETEEYNGQEREVICFFNKLGGMMNQVDPTELQKIIDEVQPFVNEALGIVNPKEENQTKDQASDQANNTQPPVDDNLPF